MTLRDRVQIVNTALLAVVAGILAWRAAGAPSFPLVLAAAVFGAYAGYRAYWIVRHFRRQRG